MLLDDFIRKRRQIGPEQFAQRVSHNGRLDARAYFSRYLLVHTHIAKTGGTSFIEGLNSIFGLEHIYDLRGKKSTPAQMPREALPPIWVLSGHIWFDTQDRPIARRKQYFMSVRDPLDRFVSLYNYVAAAKSHPGYSKYGILDIEDAFRYLVEHSPTAVSNSICSMFGPRKINALPRAPGRAIRSKLPTSFEEVRESVDRNYALVIPMKRVDDALGRIAEVFGLDPPELKHHNIGVKKATAVSDRLRQELRELNKEDYKLIAHYESVFDEHMADLPARLLR